jgi:hypothetical protein
MALRNLILIGLFSSLGITAGVWVFVIWWSRRSERRIRAWTIYWSIGGLTSLLLAASLIVFRGLWMFFSPEFDTGVSLLPGLDTAIPFLPELDKGISLLLENISTWTKPPALVLGIVGIVCFSVGCRPEGCKVEGWDLVVAVLFLSGSFLIWAGVGPSQIHLYHPTRRRQTRRGAMCYREL